MLYATKWVTRGKQWLRFKMIKQEHITLYNFLNFMKDLFKCPGY